jgi:hypothetical protein
VTIAETLYRTDPDMLFKIIVIYQLEGLARQFFPDHVVSKQEIQEDKKEYEALMMPGTYSGKAERRRGAIVQRHREVIK